MPLVSFEASVQPRSIHANSSLIASNLTLLVVRSGRTRSVGENGSDGSARREREKVRGGGEKRASAPAPPLTDGRSSPCSRMLRARSRYCCSSLAHCPRRSELAQEVGSSEDGGVGDGASHDSGAGEGVRLLSVVLDGVVDNLGEAVGEAGEGGEDARTPTSKPAKKEARGAWSGAVLGSA